MKSQHYQEWTQAALACAVFITIACVLVCGASGNVRNRTAPGRQHDECRTGMAGLRG